MNKTSRQFEGLLSRYFETLLENSPMSRPFRRVCDPVKVNWEVYRSNFRKTGSVPGSPHFAPWKIFHRANSAVSSI